jgi:antitoxin VapB
MITVPPETEQLARRVAAHSGKTPEDVLRRAVETEALLAGVTIAEGAKPAREIDADRVRQITRRVVSRPLLDPRPAKEILDDAWGRSE